MPSIIPSSNGLEDDQTCNECRGHKCASISRIMMSNLVNKGILVFTETKLRCHQEVPSFPIMFNAKLNIMICWCCGIALSPETYKRHLDSKHAGLSRVTLCPLWTQSLENLNFTDEEGVEGKTICLDNNCRIAINKQCFWVPFLFVRS